MNIKNLVTAIVAVLTFSLQTFATTLTFDNLPAPGGGSGIPAFYGGLLWNNFSYLDATTPPLPGTGYLPAVISANNVAFNAGGTPAVVSDGLFTLNSAYLTAAWNDNLQLTVTGYLGVNPIYNNTYTLSAVAPTLINFNYVGVDSVLFNSFGGSPHPQYAEIGSGTQFAMDNLVINEVPEPCTWAVGGIAGMLAVLRASVRKIRK